MEAGGPAEAEGWWDAPPAEDGAARGRGDDGETGVLGKGGKAGAWEAGRGRGGKAVHVGAPLDQALC